MLLGQLVSRAHQNYTQWCLGSEKAFDSGNQTQVLVDTSLKNEDPLSNMHIV